MNKINVLPDNLANQIAAGEVVERPASVIKELVENAIDAGSDRLQVDIELGGRRLMQVIDNGEGMTRDDSVLAFERHATSKIKTLDDLARIETLGFRGEALASIASVAKVELITKNADDTIATKIIVEGGRLVDVKDAARDTGTTIAVRDLFFNTPARRKFMRSEATENYHLTSIITHYALAHPEIAFTLTNNGRDVIRVSPAKDLRERAFQIFGGGMLESLLPVEGGREYVAKIRGYISAPRERRTTRDGQYFFVNNRFVRDKTIAGGLLEGYRSVLPHGVYPVAFLFIEIPVEEIDVNVHPAKTEIRFRRGEAVKDVIAEAVRTTLARAGITGDAPLELNLGRPAQIAPQIRALADEASQAPIEFTLEAPHEIPTDGGIEIGLEAAAAVARAFEPVNSNDSDAETNEALPVGLDEARGSSHPSQDQVRHAAAPSPAVSAPYAELPPVNSAVKLAKAIEPSDLSVSKIKPLAQMHDSFIIAVDDEGLLVIDQHVAHERILFDKYRRGETERNIESQNLLLPETIDLSPAQSEAFGLIENELGSLGFAVMKLSGRTIAIKSIPTDLPASEARNLFAEILDTIEKEKKGGAKMTLRDDIAASLACKAAVKINMKLTHEKMQWLIDRLLLTSSPTTCPHGRPVILRLSMKDIERGFHRT